MATLSSSNLSEWNLRQTVSDTDQISDFVTAEFKSFKDNAEFSDVSVFNNIKIGSKDTISALSAISPNAIAGGNDAIAGGKAFNILCAFNNSNVLSLDNTNGIAKGMTYSLRWTYAKDGKTSNENIPCCGTVLSVLSDTSEISVSKFPSYGPLAAGTKNWIWFPGKPELGTLNIGEYDIAIGEGNTNAAFKYSVAIGDNVRSSNSYSFAFGKNVSCDGYASMGVGFNVKTTGRQNVALGSQVEAGGWDTVALGLRSKAIHDYSFVWNGKNEDYKSQKDGSFCINPQRDISGVYIGGTSLYDRVDGMISNKVSAIKSDVAGISTGLNNLSNDLSGASISYADRLSVCNDMIAGKQINRNGDLITQPSWRSTERVELSDGHDFIITYSLTYNGTSYAVYDDAGMFLGHGATSGGSNKLTYGKYVIVKCDDILKKYPTAKTIAFSGQINPFPGQESFDTDWKFQVLYGRYTHAKLQQILLNLTDRIDNMPEYVHLSGDSNIGDLELSGSLAVTGKTSFGRQNQAFGECSHVEGSPFDVEAFTISGNTAISPATHAEGAGECIAGTKCFQIVGFHELSGIVGSFTESPVKNNRVAYEKVSTDSDPDILKPAWQFGINLPLPNTIQVKINTTTLAELDKISTIIEARKLTPIPDFAAQPLSISIRLQGNYDCVGEIVSIADKANGVISCSNISSNMMNWNTRFLSGESDRYNQIWLVNYPLIGDYDAGYGSHAEGYGSHAGHNAAHAEGRSSFASDKYAHAEGLNTRAHGYAAHAEGEGSVAVGMRSHAEGQSKASGTYSHAEGGSTTGIEAFYSHAEGKSTANGRYSHSSGLNTKADGYASIACGRKATAQKAHDTSFVWNCTTNEYKSQASSSFCINPKNDVSGVYIGTKSLAQHISEQAEKRLSDLNEQIENLTDENEDLKAKVDYYAIRGLKDPYNRYQYVDKSYYYQPSSDVSSISAYELSNDLTATKYNKIEIHTNNFKQINKNNSTISASVYPGVSAIQSIDFSKLSVNTAYLNFAEFSALTSIVMPDQVNSLAYFKINNTNPKFIDARNITFPKTVGDNAFYNGIYMQGSKLSGVLEFPMYNNVTVLQSVKLHNSANLSVVIPDNIKQINGFTAHGTKTDRLMMPSTLTAITQVVGQSNNNVIDFSKCVHLVNILSATGATHTGTLLSTETYKSPAEYFKGTICIPKNWTEGALSSEWQALSANYGWDIYASQLSAI